MRAGKFHLGWVAIVPALVLLIIWGTRTLDTYRTLGLRNLGSETLGGVTLQQVAILQYRYLAHQIYREVRLAVFGRTTHLPRVHLFVRDADISALDADLPASGFDYVDGRFFNGDDFSRVKVRYRGDFATHWGFFKKSWRVKTRRTDLFQGMRKFNLITPKNELMFANHFGYELARELGLMAPKSEMVVLNLNGREQGIYLLVQQIDESLLRDHERLPGDIYSGDILYGQDAWSGIGRHLFETPGAWKKVAVNNHYPEDNRYPLEQLLIAIKEQDLKTLYELIDVDAFVRLSLWENLAYSAHLDATHNWRLYFDPGRAKFYPILWDGLPFSEFWIPTDWQSSGWVPGEIGGTNPLMDLLKTSARFQERQQIIHEAFLSGDTPRRLRQNLSSLASKLSHEVEVDFPMNAALQWVPPDRAIERINRTPLLFDRIVEALADRHKSSQVMMRAAYDREQEIWSGRIDITHDRIITNDLVIDAGTEIKLANDVSLFLRGKVTINGTADNPVRFSASGSEPFGGIVIEGQQAEGSQLRHFVTSNGSGIRTPLRLYSGMLSIHDVADISLQHCVLSDNVRFDDQLHVVYSGINIDSCEFRNAPMDAIDLDASDAVITNSSFRLNGNDGLDLMHSVVVASDLSFEDNKDKGISIGERSRLTISDSRFQGNQIAMQMKDGSHALGRNLTIRQSGVAIHAYAKNWRYGDGGHGTICASDIEADTVSQFDKHSQIEMYDICPDGLVTDAGIPIR